LPASIPFAVDPGQNSSKEFAVRNGGSAMISKSRYRVAIRASASGRYTYQLFTLAGEPHTLLTDDTGFDSPQEAERAGYEAIERMDFVTAAAAMPARTEPSTE
jgi:hypothetical protein